MTLLIFFRDHDEGKERQLAFLRSYLHFYCQVLISLAAVFALASAQDWTCEECEEGGHAAAAFLSTEEGITTQTQILVTDTCPEHPDPDYCGEHMPEWWGAIGPIVWHEHFEYICDDLDCPEHNHTMKATVPSCEACTGRVNGASDALAWEETITAWVAGKIVTYECNS